NAHARPPWYRATHCGPAYGPGVILKRCLLLPLALLCVTRGYTKAVSYCRSRCKEMYPEQLCAVASTVVTHCPDPAFSESLPVACPHPHVKFPSGRTCPVTS